MFRAVFLVIAIVGVYALPATSGVSLPAIGSVACFASLS